jgi:hypothetical protein
MTVSISPPHREPNGRKQRATSKAAIEAAQRAKEEREKSTVREQRLASGATEKNWTDQRWSSPIGSFIMRAREQSTWEPYCEDAMQELRGIVRRWRMVEGLSDPETGRNTEGVATMLEVDPMLPTRLFNRWQDAIGYVRWNAGSAEAVCVKDLCEEYSDIQPGKERIAIRGLISLARHFGMA